MSVINTLQKSKQENNYNIPVRGLAIIIDAFFAKLYIPLAIIPLRRAYFKSTDFIYETGGSLSDDPNGISREPVSLHHKAYH